jgi:hypothetical protein
MSKPQEQRYTVAVDFDGVLHSYTTPWKNARTIPDEPIPGAMEWLDAMVKHFNIAIFSTRNHQWGGCRAMRRWLRHHLTEHYWDFCNKNGSHYTHMDVEEAAERCAEDVVRAISFPKVKPQALVYLDDRAVRFQGHFPTKEEIHRLRPWKVYQVV